MTQEHHTPIENTPTPPASIPRPHVTNLTSNPTDHTLTNAHAKPLDLTDQRLAHSIPHKPTDGPDSNRHSAAYREMLVDDLASFLDIMQTKQQALTALVTRQQRRIDALSKENNALRQNHTSNVPSNIVEAGVEADVDPVIDAVPKSVERSVPLSIDKHGDTDLPPINVSHVHEDKPCHDSPGSEYVPNAQVNDSHLNNKATQDGREGKKGRVAAAMKGFLRRLKTQPVLKASALYLSVVSRSLARGALSAIVDSNAPIKA